MCPDGELLSAFIDGEIPSPWKEKIALHLETCDSCSEKLKSIQIIGTCLRETPIPDFTRSESIILAAVESRGRARAPFWTKKISLPFPLAAAAAIAVLILALAYIVVPQTGGRTPALADVNTMESLPVSAKTEGNLTDLLRYLDSQDAQVTITVELPNEAKFGSGSEPELIKASDFGRSPRR